ncbi:MAG: ATP-binding protein [Bacteroidaceae bacterium]|nr:ATP-binding protein [Bacteroidaceae bacterium]
MEENRRQYTMGVQTFERIVGEKLVYVDKTDLVWKLAQVSPYVFLSRPRRFGKSLLTTTLMSYFQGRRDLFEGLKIMELEKEWKDYPVIHIDLSVAKGQDGPKALGFALKDIISYETKKYNLDIENLTPGQCLKKLIDEAFTQSDSKVVVLIDEYDAPLLEVMHEKEEMDAMRRVMQEFYQPLKASESKIRFCFLTGITRFSQLSIFSTLNNIADVSLVPDYATICGITERELTTVLRQDIETLAAKYKCSYEDMHAKLKLRYDGYHFSEDSEEVYNPYSLVKCFTFKKLDNYWFDSGTPTFLLNQMKRFGTNISKMDNIIVPASAFYSPTETMTTALPLLYQSGYLTIKDYDYEGMMYQLHIPNQEVRVGFTEGLLPFVAGLDSAGVQMGFAVKFWKSLRSGDIDLALREMKAFLAGVPYVEGFKRKLEDVVVKEGFYEYTFYLILSMLNVYVQTQVRTNDGRIDMTLFMPDTIYIFEFKVHSSAAAALRQIKDNGYAAPYATDPRRVVLVGVSFDLASWTINEWVVE